MKSYKQVTIMTYTELYEMNGIWKEIDDMVNELMGDKDVQIVLETSADEMDYWLVNHFVINENKVPILTWSGDEGNLYDFYLNDWQELKEQIFELITDGTIINYYIESI